MKSNTKRPAAKDKRKPARKDHVEGSLDMNLHLVKNALATFYVRAEAHPPYGVAAGDLLVVDRSLLPDEGELIIAEEGDVIRLRPFAEGDAVWGVVTHVVHETRGRVFGVRAEWEGFDLIDDGGAR
jgi:hypothetical protein